MIELTVKEYLKSVLNVPVEMEKPDGKKEFVLIEKTGSGQKNFVNKATIVIQSWSDSLYKASELNEKVKEAMIGDNEHKKGIIEFTEVSKCSLNTDYNYTDTKTKSYRYQAVFDLVF